MRFKELSDVFKIEYPGKYPMNQKPPEINLYSNAPHSRAPARHMWHDMPGQFQPPMDAPYGYYPLPYVMPHWYAQPQTPAVPAPKPASHPSKPTDYPKISDWLEYCDRHLDRYGENFSSLSQKFDQEGYRRIHQLAGDRVSVEKLSTWLGIGKGTADLLIRYAEEDVELIRAGTFSMSAVYEQEGLEDYQNDAGF